MAAHSYINSFITVGVFTDLTSANDCVLAIYIISIIYSTLKFDFKVVKELYLKNLFRKEVN